MNGLIIVILGIVVILISFWVFLYSLWYRKHEGKRIQDEIKNDYDL